jgi:hypothetical protein
MFFSFAPGLTVALSDAQRTAAHWNQIQETGMPRPTAFQAKKVCKLQRIPDLAVKCSSGEIVRGQLSEDGTRFLRRVAGFRDRASDDDMRSSGGNRLGGRHNARLVVMAASGRANAGGHDYEIVPKLFSQRGTFTCGGYYSLTAIRDCEGSQTQDLL